MHKHIKFLEAAKMAKENRSVKEILENIYEMADMLKVYFIVNEISFLEKVEE